MTKALMYDGKAVAWVKEKDAELLLLMSRRNDVADLEFCGISLEDGNTVTVVDWQFVYRETKKAPPEGGAHGE